MRKARLLACFLLPLLLLTACAAGQTVHTYNKEGCSHVYGSRYNVVPVTCQTPGTVARYCKICHAEVSEAVAIPTDIMARAHAFSDEVKEPTESTEGYTTRHCALCGYEIARAFVVPAKYALLETEDTKTVAPAGADGLVFSDTKTHVLVYDVARDATVSADAACRLAVALTLADELTREGTSVTPDTPVPFGSGSLPAKQLLFAVIADYNPDALRALSRALCGNESAFSARVAARLVRLGVDAQVTVDPFSPIGGYATLGGTAVLLARVLDEPLLLEGFTAAAESDLSLVAGQSPLLYLISADGTLRVSAIAAGESICFAAVFGETLPPDYEIALYLVP